MRINTALILCAGYGKRLNPITLKIPKPLIKINEITLLENSINFLEKLEIEKIKINTYFLHNKIQDFILNYKSNLKIIGIFTRLSIRDKKHNYLKLIPYAWKLIEQRTENNKKFIELKIILDKYFSKKLRNKYEN